MLKQLLIFHVALLAPGRLQASPPTDAVSITGLPSGATTGAAAPWHWVEGSGQFGGRALESGDIGSGTESSWLEMQVAGPDRLYFRYRITALTGIPFDLPVVFARANYRETNWPLGEAVRYATSGMDDARWQSPLPLRLETVSLLPLRLSLGGSPLALPTSFIPGPAVGSAEYLGGASVWAEYRVYIPRGRHRLRWETGGESKLKATVALDGVKLESGTEVAITSTRLITVQEGLPFRFGMTTNHRRGVIFSARDLPEGLQLNAASGVLAGVLAAPGVYYPQITASDSRGSSDTIIFHVDAWPNPGPALDEPRLAWTQGRDDATQQFPTTVDNAETTDGVDALRIAPGAWLETTIAGPERLSFAVQNQTTTATPVEITLNGRSVPLSLPQAQNSATAWSRYVINIPFGRHRLRWRAPPNTVRQIYTLTDGWYGGRQGLPSLSLGMNLPDNYVFWPFLSSGVQLDDVRLETRPRPVIQRVALMVGAADSPFSRSLGVTGASSVEARSLPTGITLKVSLGAFSLTGTPQVAGRHKILLTARNSYGITESMTEMEIVPAIAPALDSGGLTWRTASAGGMLWEAVPNSPWDYAHQPWDGEDALWVRDLDATAGANEAWIETTVIGPDTIHFRWKRGDYADPAALRVFMDGAAVESLTAPRVWQSASLAIPAGPHTLRWLASTGAATSALDQVRLSSDSRAFILEEEPVKCTALRPFSRALQFSRTPDKVEAAGSLPPGLTLTPSGVFTGTPASSGWWDIDIITHTAAGTTTRRITVQAEPPCFPDWLAARSLAGTSFSSDSDGDGLNLYMEFALGGDPNRPDRDFAPKLSFAENAITWEFPRGDYDTANTVVLMDCSSDLKSWFPVHCYAAVDDIGRPVHRGGLNWFPLPEQAYFRIRATVPALVRD